MQYRSPAASKYLLAVAVADVRILVAEGLQTAVADIVVVVVGSAAAG